MNNLNLAYIDSILLFVFGFSVTGALYFIFTELAKLSPLVGKYILEDKDIDGAIKNAGYTLSDKVAEVFERGVRLGVERAEKFLVEKASKLEDTTH